MERINEVGLRESNPRGFVAIEQLESGRVIAMGWGHTPEQALCNAEVCGANPLDVVTAEPTEAAYGLICANGVIAAPLIYTAARDGRPALVSAPSEGVEGVTA